jgi:hypothetical protein
MWNNSFHHYGVYSGRYSAGLGNEIFSFSKIQIAVREFPGKIYFPKYRPKLHELPDSFRMKASKFYNLRIRFAKVQKRLLIIDNNLYHQTSERIQNWDYAAVLRELISQNPSKRHLLHSSRMSGGYLSIQSYRDSLNAKISGTHPTNPNPLSVTLHIRGSIPKKRHFYSRKVKDFSTSSEQMKYGHFNIETPVSFYLQAIECLYQDGSLSKMLINIVTNLDPGHPKIQELAGCLEERNLNYKIVNGSELYCMNVLINSKVIIPSVSSFSLLAIFLSDSKYFWPVNNLFGSKNVFSIWGYEAYQQGNGPTELNRRALAKSLVNQTNRIRGLPFPLQGNIDIRSWINEDQSLSGADLIYYGVVPKVFD